MPRVVRVRRQQGDLSVHAIVGTRVALFGMDVPKAAIDDLMGFAIRRTDQPGGRTAYLPNFLLFEVNDRGDRSNHSSNANPFQEFLWGDYTLVPDRRYTYRVTAKYGAPGKLRNGDSVELEVTTESETDDRHGVFFNRGVAGSQRYVVRFGDKTPHQAGDEAFDWLQRGLLDGMKRFIGQADGPTKGLRAAVYEFTYRPVAEELANAARAGADVAIVYDSVKGNKRGYPARENAELIEKVKLTAVATSRTRTTIAHNKFIVLLEDGEPTEVWTGSTNFTEGGLFGQSNVGHVVRDRTVARRYLDYWVELQRDPERPAARAFNDQKTPTPAGNPPARKSISLFSPRQSLSALDWYAERMDEARGSVFLTAAFGVSEPIRAIFDRKKPYLRYLLLDKPGEVTTINRNPSNRAVASREADESQPARSLRSHQVHAHRPTGRRPDRDHGLGQLQQGLDDDERREHAGHTRRHACGGHLSRRVHAPLHALPLSRQDEYLREPADPEPRRARGSARQQALPEGHRLLGEALLLRELAS